MIEQFLDQTVFRGRIGAAGFIAEKLRELAVKRVFLVTGKKSYQRSGAESFIDPFLNGVEVERFCDFASNPELSDVLEGMKRFQQFKPDCIIAAGGGSVLDMAKLISFFGSTKLDALKYLTAKSELERRSLLPFIAIPTTAGTGSEATHFSVLYHNKVKYSVAEPCLVPDIVVLNPELTYAMTPYQTACTGMDALAQAVEAHWAKAATPESRRYAEKAISLAVGSFEKAVRHPDNESRQMMQEAAYWAGRAINISKTTVCHALSYYLTSHYNYPHGHAVGLTLPEVFEVHQKQGVVSDDLMGCFGGENPTEYLKKLRRMMRLSAFKRFELHDVEDIVSAVNLERLENNPVQFRKEVLVRIVSSGLGRCCDDG